MEQSEDMVTEYLSISDEDGEGDWRIADVVESMIGFVSHNKVSQAEALFFMMHSYWILMEGVEHAPLIEFYTN
jgi:hypothetical protein